MRRIGTFLLAMAAALAAAAPALAQMGGPATVYLEPVEKRSVRQSAELIGGTEARRQSTIGAETAGRVEKMAADAGDFVRAGQPLARMRTLPVELQLKKAEAQLAGAQAMLAKMEAGFRKEEIDQAEARARAAQAGVERWTQEHERTRKLLADGASTQAEMDVTEAAFRQAKQTLAEAEAGLALVKSGNRPEDIANARAQAATASAAVEELRDILAKMTVAMPFDGFVIRKLTEEGQWLQPGAPVAEVVDIAVVRVCLDVPERYLAGLTPGIKAPVVFDALGDREFAGEVSQIVPSSSQSTHTVKVRVDVKNEMANGRPLIAEGLVARVWLPVGAEHEALMVPKSAVIRQMGQDLVYTVSDTPPPAAVEAKPAAKAPAAKPAAAGAEPPKPLMPPPPTKFAVAVPIKIIQGYGRYMEVESGALKPGMSVVTRGTYLLSHGAAVQERAKETGGAAK